MSVQAAHTKQPSSGSMELHLLVRHDAPIGLFRQMLSCKSDCWDNSIHGASWEGADGPGSMWGWVQHRAVRSILTYSCEMSYNYC